MVPYNQIHGKEVKGCRGVGRAKRGEAAFCVQPGREMLTDLSG